MNQIIKEKKLSARCILAISKKLSINDQQTLYKAYFLDYKGRDRNILEFCLKNAISEIMELNNIGENLEVVKYCYKENLYYSHRKHKMIHRNLLRKRKFPLKYAKEIMTDSVSYPRFLVELAESVCKADVASKAVLVGDIAKKEQWFE